MEITQGANPFLMMSDDHVSPSSNMNPFLMDASDFSLPNDTLNDNPFFSVDPTNTAGSLSTNNPFAFDSMDYEPVHTSTTNYFSDNEAIFTSAQTYQEQPQISQQMHHIEQNLMDDDNLPGSTVLAPTITAQKPTELDLHSTISSELNNSDDFLMDKGPPKRPPPPRPPVIPPSKETQDLILSVTGALDATSTHLLDRIPPTRTPSPVLMRDLHSPSPTPDQSFVDLLDVGNTEDMSTNQPQDQVNLFDIDDSPNNPSSYFESNAQQNINSVMQPVMAPEPKADLFESLMDTPADNTICDINQNQTAPLPTLQPVSMMSPLETQQNISMMSPLETQQPISMMSPLETQQPVSMMSPLETQQPVVTKPQRPAPPPHPARPSHPPKVPPHKPPPPKINAAPPPRPPSPLPPAPNYMFAEEIAASNVSTSNANTENLFQSEIHKPAANFIESTTVKQDIPVPEKVHDDIEFLMNSNDVTNEATILEEKVPSPQVDNQYNNSNTNPFSFQEETSAQQDIIVEPKVATDLLGDSEPMLNNTNILTSMTFPKTETATILDVFENKQQNTTVNVTSNQNVDFLDDFNSNEVVAPIQQDNNVFGAFEKHEEFDAFAMKFESAAKDVPNDQGGFDPFGASSGGSTGDTWGDPTTTDKDDSSAGFGADDTFDAFLSMTEPPPVPQTTPARISKGDSDSDEDKAFDVFIKPKNLDISGHYPDDTNSFVPTLAPPPKSPIQSSISDSSPRFNPFDQQEEFGSAVIQESGATLPLESAHIERTDSQETPPTPLFDDDTSLPLEEFPRAIYKGEGWEMQLRQPNKKKITGQRFWKKIFVRLVYQGDNPVIQLFNAQGDKDPFQELPLQACYSVSEIGAQQYDQFGKIFTIKLQYIFYKERPGVRPGQVTKAERITNKLSQFAAYAIQGDYQGVKEFGSDLKKLGLPVEHAPQISQLFKIGSTNYEHVKEFSCTVEEALFRLTVHRDRALHYKMEEVQITCVDELYVEQNAEGGIDKQIARVRLFFLGFLSGMPDIELGVNDMRRQGKEVVGRHDIIPVVTEEWIRLENCEFHACVQQDEYQKCHIIKFKPPDACYIELMRFRIRPPRNRELPLQLKATMCVTGNKVELRADVLVPGFASRKLGQVPCEDVMIRFPIPECWIYLFRVEKHFRYGSVKSAHRRTGKIKGIERFLGAVDTLQESLIEVTSGQAKYEHQHRSIVWRCPRLPKEGQGAYTTHNLICRMALTSYDQIPEKLTEYCYIEFTMPATQASHTTVRSVSVQGSDSDEPPEKYVRYLARHEYRVGIEHTKGEGPAAYVAATIVRPPSVAESVTPTSAPEAESSDSDSD